MNLPVCFFNTKQFISCGVAPGNDIFLDAFVCGYNFKYLAYLNLLDFVCRFKDRHRAHKAVTIQSIVCFHNANFLVQTVQETQSLKIVSPELFVQES